MLKIYLLLLISHVDSFAQRNITVNYSHTYGVVSFKKENPHGSLKREECLYINSDSLSFYSYQPQKHGSNKITIGSIADHHSLYNFPKIGRQLAQFSWQTPYSLDELVSKDYNWQIHQDTMRVEGYLCQVAVSDGIIAWFTTEIPVQFGPAAYNGLPGLALVVEDRRRRWLIKAFSIKLESPRIVIPEMKLKPCKDCESKLQEIKEYFTL